MVHGVTGTKQCVYLCEGRWQSPEQLASSFSCKPASDFSARIRGQFLSIYSPLPYSFPK